MGGEPVLPGRAPRARDERSAGAPRRGGSPRSSSSRPSVLHRRAVPSRAPFAPDPSPPAVPRVLGAAKARLGDDGGAARRRELNAGAHAGDVARGVPRPLAACGRGRGPASGRGRSSAARRGERAASNARRRRAPRPTVPAGSRPGDAGDPRRALDVEGEEPADCAGASSSRRRVPSPLDRAARGGVPVPRRVADPSVPRRDRPEPEADPEEGIEVVRRPFDEMVDEARAGRVEDAKTALALLLSAPRGRRVGHRVAVGADGSGGRT